MPEETSSTRPVSASVSYSHTVGASTSATDFAVAGSTSVSCRVGTQPG